MTSDRGASAMPQENVEETVERREGVRGNISLQNRAAQGGREETYWSLLSLINVHWFLGSLSLIPKPKPFEYDVIREQEGGQTLIKERHKVRS